MVGHEWKNQLDLTQFEFADIEDVARDRGGKEEEEEEVAEDKIMCLHVRFGFSVAIYAGSLSWYRRQK